MNALTSSRWTVLGLGLLLLALAAPQPAGAQTLNACSARKKDCVAKKAAALLNCHVKAEKKGLALDPICVQKAEDKFDGGADPAKGCFAKLEAKYGASCLTSGDTATMEAKIDAFVLDAVTDVDPGYPVTIQNTCSAGKKNCVRNKVKALLKCHAKAEKKGLPLDPSCVQKAEDKFDGGFDPQKGCFEKLEQKEDLAKPATVCPTHDDTAALEAKVDAFVLDAVCTLDTAFSGCAPICGNGFVNPGEECDGVKDWLCPGRCLPPAVVPGDPECRCAVDPTPVTAGGAHQGLVRPVEGGYSAINSVYATCLWNAGFIATGTLGAVVFAGASPHILSNSHVLGRQSDADAATSDDPVDCLGTPETLAGEPAMQPGTLDGGVLVVDDVGVLPAIVGAGAPPSLDPYEPICLPAGFCPGVFGFPLNLVNGMPGFVDGFTQNCMDAAIALLTLPPAIPAVGLASVLDIGLNATFGPPLGPPSCRDLDVDGSLVNRIVKKSGRTTGLTWGRITGVVDALVSAEAGICSVPSGNAGEDCLVDADCPVPVPGACVIARTGYGVPFGSSALYVNQIRIVDLVGSFSAGGDSGSVVFLGAGNSPVGLLFAGAPGSTIANPIRPVLARFGVTF